MALIKCPECGREISDKAVSCPGCGCPVEGDGNEDSFSYTDSAGAEVSFYGDFLKIIKKNGKSFADDYIGNYILLNVSKAGLMTKASIAVAHPLQRDSMILYFDVSRTDIFNKTAGILQRNCHFENLTHGKAVTYVTKTPKELRKEEKKAERKIARQQAAYQPQPDRNVVRCPKCKSTSIQYTTKKLSLGRALVGDAIAGAPGAILGGLSSNKGYAVCMNCGKKWKV